MNTLFRFRCVKNEVQTVPADCCSGETITRVFTGLEIKTQDGVIRMNTPVFLEVRTQQITISDNSGVSIVAKRNQCVQSFSDIQNLIVECNETGAAEVITGKSVQGAGTTELPITLVNDKNSPTAGYFYGTTRNGKEWRPAEYCSEQNGIKIRDNFGDTTATFTQGLIVVDVPTIDDTATDLKELSFFVNGDTGVDAVDEKLKLRIVRGAKSDGSFPFNNSNDDLNLPFVNITDLTFAGESPISNDLPALPVIVQSQDYAYTESKNGVLEITFYKLSAYARSHIKIFWR